VVASFAGCAGQRCMAASVLVVVGDNEFHKIMVNAVVERTKVIQAGTAAGTMGPVIDLAAKKRVEWYINNAVEKHKATLLLDGRDPEWSKGAPSPGGHWIGPTIVLHQSAADPAMQEEIFGPLLSIFCVRTATEAMKIENASPFGNAACIYTTNGATAEWFTGRFRSAMLGVNVGIPGKYFALISLRPFISKLNFSWFTRCSKYSTKRAIFFWWALWYKVKVRRW